jgi:hypothetical protein
MGGTITSGVDFSERRARGRGSERESIPEGPRVVLHPGPFLNSTLLEESVRLGVTVEELVTFAVLYYLTDRDGQRIARRIRQTAE